MNSLNETFEKLLLLEKIKTKIKNIHHYKTYTFSFHLESIFIFICLLIFKPI